MASSLLGEFCETEESEEKIVEWINGDEEERPGRELAAMDTMNLRAWGLNAEKPFKFELGFEVLVKEDKSGGAVLMGFENKGRGSVMNGTGWFNQWGEAVSVWLGSEVFKWECNLTFFYLNYL